MAYEDQATSFIGPVSSEEAKSLARLAKAGDRAASERLTLANAGLVYHEKMVRRYRQLGRWMPFQDATQEGWLAMAKAVADYDPEAGCEFSTYAWVCLHNHVNTLMKLLQSVRRDPKAVSLGVDDRGRRWIEQVVDDGRSAQESVDLTDEADNLLSPLRSRDRAIVAMRFGLETGIPATREEIGERLGVTSVRIRQLEMRAFAAMRARAANTEQDDANHQERRSA